MLKSLLRQSELHLETLELYVVAADFRKMLSRMNHPVSTHYLTFFQRVKSRTFGPIEEAPTKLYDGNDQLFLDDIPILAKLANTKIPNLEAMAQVAMKNEPFKLYNKDTCMEFHELLCELLERFHESLKDLKGVEKLKVKKRKKAAQIDQSDREEIMDRLERVLALGKAIRAIVRGSAIKAHLVTIAPFLEVKTGKLWPMAHESEVDAETENDAEFSLLKPYSSDGRSEPLLPWKSLHDWLRLMIHHFDAIHVLDNHLMTLRLSKPIDISIKIIYPSLPDDKMLPWKELLKNEKYFPKIQQTPDQPSAAELITFLTSPTLDEDGNSVKDIIDDVDTIKQKQITTETVYADFTTDVQTLTESVADLKESSSDGWEDYVADILKQVEALRSDSTTFRLSRLEGISSMLENLKESFLLYKRVQPGTPLSLGKGFAGSCHCEVDAAVLNSLSGTPGPHNGLSEELLEEYKVSRIPFLAQIFVKFYNTDDRTCHWSV